MCSTRGGRSVSTMPSTCTPGSRSCAAPRSPRSSAANTGWRERYTPSAVGLATSAFAILLATVFSRVDCAESAEPAISKMRNRLTMAPSGLLSAQRFAQAVDARREEIEARLVADRRLGERRLLELGVDGIAV